MNRTATILGAAAAVALAAGCTSKNNSGGGLSVSTRASVSTGAASSDGLELSNGITISHIQMAVRRVSVEGDDAFDACGAVSTMAAAEHGDGSGGSGGSGGPGRGDDGEGGDDGKNGPREAEDGECELSFGPFDVDLAGSALTNRKIAFAFDAPIPAGTYEEVKISIHTVSAEHSGSNQVLQDLAAAHASILIDGFVQVDSSTSKRFTFSTPMEVKQKREGKIVIGPDSNVTLDFDPSHWFDGAAGGRLDPNDPNDQGAILANIRASIRIIKDDDEDGVEDEMEHHGGGADDPPGHH